MGCYDKFHRLHIQTDSSESRIFLGVVIAHLPSNACFVNLKPTIPANRSLKVKLLCTGYLTYQVREIENRAR